MINIDDIRVAESKYGISMSKLTGKKIVDIVGYISGEFGFSVFKICDIVFEDGTKVGIDGEHDIAFIPQDSDKNMPPNMDKATLDYLAES